MKKKENQKKERELRKEEKAGNMSCCSGPIDNRTDCTTIKKELPQIPGGHEHPG